MTTKPISIQLFSDVCGIIDRGREKAYAAVNNSIIETYWNIGRRIVEEEQQGKERAGYGEQIIEKLSEQLAMRYGKGFSTRYLRAFRKFYLTISDDEIWKSRFPNLTWTHIFKTLRVENETAIRWYLETASQEMHVEERWGESVIKQLSKDLRLAIDEAKGLTPGNLYYCKRFYLLYNQLFEKVPQVGEIIHHRLGSEPQNGDLQIVPQLGKYLSPCIP